VTVSPRNITPFDPPHSRISSDVLDRIPSPPLFKSPVVIGLLYIPSARSFLLLLFIHLFKLSLGFPSSFFGRGSEIAASKLMYSSLPILSYFSQVFPFSPFYSNFQRIRPRRSVPPPTFSPSVRLLPSPLLFFYAPVGSLPRDCFFGTSLDTPCLIRRDPGCVIVWN